ncbi:uncharacterized protein LAJ45_10319 [Morchella importuna]|uniref:uncharacterized protein n=1 Tax=Morchella importuna TaxID=1174673 RepID=UPI001E8DAC9C|nr:uncharacterized protein LAJ45_10319 [Morchella importuna]KAH8145679.1 hypothetical protein LAJ45_10319 [Morchella importuna]
MSLGTETTNVLYRNLDALTYILSPAQLSAMTESERSTALQTLLVTAEAAARLAEAKGEGKGEGYCPAKTAAGMEETVTAAETGAVKSVGGRGKRWGFDADGVLKLMDVEDA